MPESFKNQAILLSAKLGEVAIRNTADTIMNKISASKARKNNEKTIVELEEIINGLISDKNELIQISRAYEEEFVMRKISEQDMKYITDNLIPVLANVFSKITDSEETSKTSSEIEDILKVLKPILSVETFTILQLLGFDFKAAIGEALTKLLRSIILSQISSGYTDLTKIVTPELVELLKNKSAYDNFNRLIKD